MSCGTFIKYIGDNLKRKMNADLAKAKFYSLLCDGSTDKAVIENEVIYALHFDPTPINSDSVEIKMSFIHMHQIKNQNAEGIATALTETLKKILRRDFNH